MLRASEYAGTGRPKCRDGSTKMQGQQFLRASEYAGTGIITDRWICRDGGRYGPMDMQGRFGRNAGMEAVEGRWTCRDGSAEMHGRRFSGRWTRRDSLFELISADEHVGTAFLSLFRVDEHEISRDRFRYGSMDMQERRSLRKVSNTAKQQGENTNTGPNHKKNMPTKAGTGQAKWLICCLKMQGRTTFKTKLKTENGNLKTKNIGF